MQWRDFDASAFRILIADDLEDTRFVLRRALTIEGFQIDEATNGEELLEVASLRPPDLMIVDIMMPRLDGLSALAEIRKDPKLAHAYIILLTGKSSVNEKMEGFQLGADDYVTKPYSLGELKARVKAGIRLKSLQRHLMESQQILIRQEKLATIGVLAAGVAHEFNNIMSGISGYAQLARNSEKFVDRLIEVALDQSERAQKITSSLTTFAGSASGSSTVALPRELIDSAACLLQKDLRRNGTQFSIEAPKDLGVVRVNAGQVQQALVHLVLNAIQAMPSDDEETGIIAIRARSETDKIIIEVDDNGPGIPEPDRHRVFDPFFTTKGALGNSTEPGTGLGLTFALNITESHHGTLEVVESKLGGACLRLQLPLAQPPSPAESDEEPETGRLPARVVLGEDDESIQEVVVELLRETPPVVYETGEAVIAHCREHEVDVLILDVSLVGSQDGWQVLKTLKELRSPPPVILTSGSLSHTSPAGVDYPKLWLLPKPFRLAELEAVLSKVSGLRRQEYVSPALD